MFVKTFLKSSSRSKLKKIFGFFLLLNPYLYWKYIDLESKKKKFDFLIQDKFLIKTLYQLEDINTIFEFGCGFGDRLYNIKKEFGSDLTLDGFDINQKRIQKGSELLLNNNIDGILLSTKENKNKYDIVFTSMTLIYFNENQIIEILKKLINKTNKYLILQEVCSFSNMHKSTLFAHNYFEIFKKLDLKNFKFDKIPNPNWERGKDVYGVNIIISL